LVDILEVALMTHKWPYEELEHKYRELERKYSEHALEVTQLRRRTKDVSVLSTLCCQLSSTLSPDSVVSHALEEILSGTLPDATMLFLLDEDHLILKGVRPQAPRYRDVGTVVKRPGECLCGLVASSREPVYSMDIHGDRRCTLDECKDAGLRSFAGLPLMDGDEILGLLGVTSSTPRDFSKEAPFLEDLARQVGVALQNAFRHEEVKNRAAELERRLDEARHIEDALRESEAKYRLLVEHAPAGILEVDFGTDRFLNVNDVMCEYTGYTREEFLSMSPFDILTEESQDLFSERLIKTGSGEKVPEAVEYRVRTKSGRELWVILNARQTYENGKAVGATVVVHDITELKRVEEARRESEEKYRLLVENANDGIFIAQSGVIKFPNPKTQEILGYTALELAETPYLDMIHPEDRHIVIERKRRRNQGEDLPNTYSLRITNSSGDELWAQVNAVDITWEGAEATLNFVRDITPHKRLEAQFSQAQKMEAVGTLAGGIAHDFNNLLMGIQGNVSLMLLDIDEGDPHYDRMKNIEHQVLSGAELTRQLLGFARGGKYEVKAVNLNELVEESAAMFGRAKKEIEIHRGYQEDLSPVEVDQGQIEQVLLNLFVNAWQAMPGGGKLFLKTKDVILDRTGCKPFRVVPGRYVKLAVTDTGMGMDEATRQRIFEPFFTTKDRGIGTGLGLASVYGIIKNHGGIIEVSSKVGKGTTFTIYLPASERHIETDGETSEKILQGKETVLLVDDEEMVIYVGKQMLERLGYQVLPARSGKEAVRVYRENKERINLVILDMIMPKLSGGETYEEIRQVNPDVKVLLSSGYSIDGQATEILRRGCDGFIQKPFTLEQLSRKVREILP
jgi:two-component system cell cycle sensor histidine kinase/response regulator CckA